MTSKELRNLPSVGQLAEHKKALILLENYSRKSVIATLRSILDEIRGDLVAATAGGSPVSIPAAEEILARARNELERAAQPGIRKAINATGVILHTGLGRAVLCPSARKIIGEMDGYSLVQMDVSTGKRSVREAHIEALLRELTGAEAATVANNNAGATLLVLNTLAKGKEVIVSRGQLVEIGGAFRIPDVMKQSGATLVEVGTTNRTHLRDYERAINENTAALLHVHTSNYRIMGFTKTVGVDELVTLGRKYSLPVVDDLGSGALVDLSRFGFSSEPLVRDSVKAGVDMVTFSADKLVGGPQGGIILGRQDAIQKVRKNSLMRALRVGKLTLSALEMTLREFLDEERLLKNHPVLRLFSIPQSTLRRRARRLAAALEKAVPGIDAVVEKGAGMIGSGSLPIEDIPTWIVSVQHPALESGRLGGALQLENPPIFSRVSDNRITFDLRTILNSKEEQTIVRSISNIVENAQ